MKNSLGLDYLKPLFERGGTTEAAAQFFAEVHGTTLGAEYWGWVKNQAIEKKFKISDAMGEGKCHIVSLRRCRDRFGVGAAVSSGG